jgi:hypothetical protein
MNNRKVCPYAGCGRSTVKAYRPFCSFEHQFLSPVHGTVLRPGQTTKKEAGK